MTPDKKRLNITLLDDDVTLANKIKGAVEKRLGIKVSMAFVIKLALRDQAISEKLD